MKSPYLFFAICYFFCLPFKVLQAQSPPYATSYTSVLANVYPFNITLPAANQSLILPGELNGPSGGAPNGIINKIYFQGHTNAARSFQSIQIKMAQVSMGSFPAGNMFTGTRSLVFADTNVTYTSDSLGWMCIPLQFPFSYNANLSLIIEVSVCGSYGDFFVQSRTIKTGTNRQVTSYLNCTMSYYSHDDVLNNIGFNIQSKSLLDAGVTGIIGPANYCSSLSTPIKVRVSNFGKTVLSSLRVNWSLNGVAQPYINFPINLDTTGGLGNSSALLNLGNISLGPGNNQIQVNLSHPNGLIDNNTINDTFSYSKRSSLNGNYTINPVSNAINNYKTFTELCNDLSVRGICGPVTVLVSAGTYNEKITIPSINGISEQNTLTIDGVDPNTRIVDGFFPKDAAITLMNPKYTTIKNLGIYNMTNNNGVCLLALGNPMRLRVENCDIRFFRQLEVNTLGYGILFTNDKDFSQRRASAGDSVQIINNKISGGSYGICFLGTSNSNYNMGIRIEGNTILYPNHYGIEIIDVYNPLSIIGNVIRSNGDYNGLRGLVLNNNLSNHAVISHVISGNTISDFTQYGMQISDLIQSSSAAPVYLTNNIIKDSKNDTKKTLYGIQLSLISGANAYVEHNTIVIGNASNSSSSSCLSILGSNLIFVRNNNLHLTGANGIPYYSLTSITGNRINFNNYYRDINPSTGNLLKNGSSTYTASNFKSSSAGGDSSICLNPSYSGIGEFPLDYKLVQHCNFKGTNLLVNVPIDLLGNPRSSKPTIGALEFLTYSNNLSIQTLQSPINGFTNGNQDLKFTTLNIGNNLVNSYLASYTHNGGSSISIVKGPLLPCQLDTITFTGVNQVNMGNRNQIVTYTSLPNSLPDYDKNNDSLKTGLFAPLSGSYTIGLGNTDFKTITGAITTLNQVGVSGPVQFFIQPGTYSGPAIIPSAIPGSNNSNKIIFEGTDPETRIITCNDPLGCFQIYGAANISIRNLQVLNQSASLSPLGIMVSAINSNLSVSNISMIKNKVSFSNSWNGIGILVTGNGYTNSQILDSLTIDSNTLINCGIGIRVYGCYNTLSNQGIKIRNNNILEASYGIEINQISSPLNVLANKVELNKVNGGSYGITVNYCGNFNTTIPHKISNNQVSGFNISGIYLDQPAGNSSSAPIQVYNNILNGKSFGTEWNSYGIYLNISTNAIAKLYHNTVNVNTGNSALYSSCIYAGGSTEIFIKNNILTYETGAGVPLYCYQPIIGNKVNYNQYFNGKKETNPALVYNSGSYFNSSNFNTNTAGGTNSYVGNANYIQKLPLPGNLKLKNACVNRGENLIADVNVDIFNQLRSTTPSIGAHEPKKASRDLGVNALLSPQSPVLAGPNSISVLVINNGTVKLDSFTLTYILNGGIPVSQKIISPLFACDTLSVLLGSANFSGIIPNQLLVYSSLPNGLSDLNPDNDTIRQEFQIPMAGLYTIGQNPPFDFGSFSDAISALNLRGISNSVTFKVKTGKYFEAISVGVIAGASATKPILFESEALQADSVELQWNTLKDFNKNYVLKFEDNASYISFKNLTIRQLWTSGNHFLSTIRFEGGASYDSLIQCKLLFPYTAMAGNAYSIYGKGLSGKGIGFKNNIIRGSKFGAYWFGDNYNPVSHTTFEGNTFDSASYGQFDNLSYTRFTKFINNNLYQYPQSAINTNLIWNYNDSTFIVEKNRFIFQITAYFEIKQSRHNGLNPRSSFSNNVISGTNLSINYGLNVQQTDFCYNTILTGGSNFGFDPSGGSSFKFRNNIFYGKNTTCFNWYGIPSVSNISSDYNLFFAELSNTPIQTTAGTYNLNGIQNLYTGFETNSIQALPGLISQLNPKPNAADSNVWNINGRGEIQNNYPTDILNQVRPTTIAAGVPDLGAYEISPTSLPPNVKVIPLTPIAGQTQVMTQGYDTVLTLAWTPSQPVPSTISGRIFTGTPSPQIGNAIAYSNFYVQLIMPPGTYSFVPRLFYNPSWRGTISTETAIRMSVKQNQGPWSNLVGATSITDTIKRVVSSASALTLNPIFFTLTDNAQPLPVNLLYFTGHKVEQNVSLNWVSSNEQNSDYYLLERSMDGINFVILNKVKAKGNSQQQTQYQYLDKNALELASQAIYYRLSSVDINYQKQTHNLVKIDVENNSYQKIKVYPNPFQQKLFIDFSPEPTDKLEIIDLEGRVVFSETVNINNPIQEIDLRQLQKNGVYFLSIQSSFGKQVFRIIKQ